MNIVHKKDIIIYIIIIIVILLSYLSGYLIGKNVVLENVGEQKIKYIELDPIHDTITEFKVKYIPADTIGIIETCIEKGLYSELFPWKVDTIFTSRDTNLILSDWASKREYSKMLFDIDSIGKLNVNLGIQYNRLDTLNFDFIPIQKHTVNHVIVKHNFEPFIGGGISVGVDRSRIVTPGLNADIGFFIKQHHGLELQYQYLFGTIQNYIISATYIYKF